MEIENILNYKALRKHVIIASPKEDAEKLQKRQSVVRLINLIKMWERQELERIGLDKSCIST